MGTFRFLAKRRLYGMVYGNGGFDMGNLPSRQQDQRVQYHAGSFKILYVHTVPFNNHDTFAPGPTPAATIPAGTLARSWPQYRPV
jgi:hypothetical protein